MTILSRWLAPAVLAVGFGVAAMAPTPAQARDDDLVRVIVDVADVIYHGGYPYYRHGGRYGYADRLVVVRDRYRGPVYYRYVPRHVHYRSGPPYGHAYGYWRDGRRWRDRDDYYEYRRWQVRDYRRDWDRDRDWDRRNYKHKHKYKYRHGRGRDRDDD